MEYKLNGEWVKLKRTVYNYNNSLAIVIYRGKGDYDKLTTCLDVQPTDSNCAFVDTRAFPDVESFLIKNNVAEPTGRCHMENYYTYPEYRFKTAYMTYL